ncbi:hypothetical protein H4W31_004794 [Plantactinospora soyae]|uniref:Uncharacterized protein n=2 Tax=Plantactinospora soyae TaxID=1544732 RepID=A0A927M9Q0_9ACTN|nr:hypothetical protein [Plantactinospora soyae]MBE1489156.1 hypothetical protein [Plantactinospora soyae]
MDTLDHLPDLTATLGNLLHDVHLVLSENLFVNRGHGKQDFHHHRRPPPTIDALFARYGLIRLPAHSPSDPLTVWNRTPSPALRLASAFTNSPD